MKEKKMDIDTMKKLLDKFYQGETSLEEEQALEDFLLEADLGEEWAGEVDLITCRRLARLSGKKIWADEPSADTESVLDQEDPRPAQADLDRSRIRLEKSIDGWAESEETHRKHRWKHIYQMSGGIAAAIVLGTGIYTWSGGGLNSGNDMGMSDSGKSVVGGSGLLSEQIASLDLADTYSDPQKAWDMAQQVLGQFASAMEKGEAGMQVVGEKNRKVQEKLNETINF